MKKFKFYEFAGILVPGGLFVTGILLLFPEEMAPLRSDGVTFGEFGLLLILSYALGHLVQSIGNFVEWVWWLMLRGMPTDWVRSGKRTLISKQQMEAVRTKLQGELNLSLPDNLTTLSKQDWYSIVRQVFTNIMGQGKTSRIDTFNANYGMNRGIAAALLGLILVALGVGAEVEWKVYAVIAILTGLALLRMHRFGVHYGRELFVQFLSLERK